MKLKHLLIVSLIMAMFLTGCGGEVEVESSVTEEVTVEESADNSVLYDIPEDSDTGYIFLNDNEPEFADSEITEDAFEEYSPLDSLGRCGTAYACLGRELMPTEDRESISHIYPTGWQSVEYDIVEGGSLYNRSHLIGFQLAGENDNERNLITGTRYMNAHVMLPFENLVADYISDTGNHVMYRVTPYYEGDNLVASGVQMEAYSVEDWGADICFNVYIYNMQPGIVIDYATGDNWLDEDYEADSDEGSAAAVTAGDNEASGNYVLNTNSMKFHYPECRSVDDMADYNKETYKGSRSKLIEQGYDPCGNCNP